MLRAIGVMLLLASLALYSRALVQAQDEEIRIGLALGSGGASGLAHISMLAVFDEVERQPDIIAGTSIGAVIGGLYAAGLDAAEIRDIFDDFAGSELDALSGLLNDDNGLNLRDLLQLDFNDGGIIDAEGFIDFLRDKVDARDFDDLRIPLIVVATDYWSGDMVTLDSGDLFTAIKASMAAPGIFSPVTRNELLLIDGGTSNPLPYDLLSEHSDLVVAVDVSGSRSREENDSPELLDILFSTFEIMQQSIIRARMEHSEPDLYLQPDASGVRLLHFNRLETIEEQAESATGKLRDWLQGER